MSYRYRNIVMLSVLAIVIMVFSCDICAQTAVWKAWENALKPTGKPGPLLSYNRWGSRTALWTEGYAVSTRCIERQTTPDSGSCWGYKQDGGNCRGWHLWSGGHSCQTNVLSPSPSWAIFGNDGTGRWKDCTRSRSRPIRLDNGWIQ